MASTGEPEHLVVGHLTKPHGTRGELLIRLLTDRPEEVFVAGRRVLVGDDRGEVGAGAVELTVERAGPHRRGWKAALEGVEDRNAAAALAGRYLLVRREERGEPGEGEFYYHQLLGLEVRTVDGREIGRVREVFETEPRHLLEVKGEAGLHLVPFDRSIIVEVELEENRLVIDPPEGLLEL